MTDLENRKRVFVSYAHKDRDSVHYVPRLVNSLDMYLDAFWDQKLQAGQWSPQLEQAVKDSDYLLVVMSYSQSESGWCQKEIQIARENNITIIPLRIHGNHDDKKLKNDQWADFTEDFDVGFRQLTSYILEQPVSSWEYFYGLNDTDIFEALKRGFIPGFIAKEFGDWMIMDWVWPVLRDCISHKTMKDDISRSLIIIGEPSVPTDLWRQLLGLETQLIDVRNFLGVDLTKKVVPLVENYVKDMAIISDIDHQLVCQIIFKCVQDTRDLLESFDLSFRDFFKVVHFRGTFEFNTASKLRELIVAHSRRSRYLY
jgi:hypothetical protein